MIQPELDFKASLLAWAIMFPSTSKFCSVFTESFGGLDVFADDVPLICSLWNVQEAIDTINQTYEIIEGLDNYNLRSHTLYEELLQQVELYGTLTTAPPRVPATGSPLNIELTPE